MFGRRAWPISVWTCKICLYFKFAGSPVWCCTLHVRGASFSFSDSCRAPGLPFGAMPNSSPQFNAGRSLDSAAHLPPLVTVTLSYIVFNRIISIHRGQNCDARKIVELLRLHWRRVTAVDPLVYTGRHTRIAQSLTCQHCTSSTSRFR